MSETELSTLREVFAKFDAIEEVILFGSRARGTHKKASDVDLAIKGKNIDLNTLSKLKYKLDEETNLPYFFDVVIYDKISDDALRKSIDEGGIKI
ncbi:nucleotidyltransferase family protein [Sulfurospirillum diekertiae]|uniref:nucleotidyltransferase family protein n=1 Tax=Sulfurospirillum diekertiae TaxID=1854492 RepID=UPI001AEF984F|nr:nucleotidyltransferase domain-containing protein [Sulfurospirillum diekertiae]